MENAEEVMQLLEEFTKLKPKDIPRELEDYLGYVAKTGDPVFQWSLVKSLFREKLLSVITDFYESTLTVELPPCPNVEPFNYERMKTSLLERFDTFTGAPFTVQRICELLTNPRKEYNRADKYMRAIEKNILVVSTREPGTGKRPLECDSQSETVINGIPEVKLSASDGNLLHVPTDLPYLGAPPASNDVTVETTELSSINDRLCLDINGDSKSLKPESEKSWLNEDSPPVSTENDKASNSNKSEAETLDTPLNTDEKLAEESESDIKNSLVNVDKDNLSIDSFESESCSQMLTQQNETVLPDSTDSSDSSQECSELSSHPIINNQGKENPDDENEVPSPVDRNVNVPLVKEVDESIGSEAEASHSRSSLLEEVESNIPSVPVEEINNSEKIAQTNENKSIITVSEITVSKSGEIDLECNEISGTVVSPISPGNNLSSQVSDCIDNNIRLTVLEDNQTESHPDSSNDICTKKVDLGLTISEESQKSESCSEADSMSETNTSTSEPNQKIEFPEDEQDNTKNEIFIETPVDVSSPGESKIVEEECLEKAPVDSILSSNSISKEQSLTTEGIAKTAGVESSSELADQMHHERNEEVVSPIQPIQNVTDSEQQITIEEISVDPTCEVEEEAMDVDDSSNQMLVSEGENEGEPMDQCDQAQS